jgi:hypothetical protein
VLSQLTRLSNPTGGALNDLSLAGIVPSLLPPPPDDAPATAYGLAQQVALSTAFRLSRAAYDGSTLSAAEFLRYGVAANFSFANGSRTELALRVNFCGLNVSSAPFASAVVEGGGFDIRALIKDFFICPSEHRFELWNFGAAGPLAVSLFDPKGREIRILPPPVAKRRPVTPFNILIGAVRLSQRRTSSVECATSRLKFLSSCLSAATSAAPYGVDPNFLPTSSLFKSDLSPASFYTPQERRVVDVGGAVEVGLPYGSAPPPIF